jgi:DHA2 family multidrug resistance protein-like MFS transporter
MNETTLAYAAPRAGRKEWIGLVILFLPTLLVSLDFTVTYLALPSISADLKPGSSQLLWISDIYGFLAAGLVLVMGALGDRIGRRKILLIGAIGFAIASTGAAFSTSANMLITFRALLGIAGATLLPSTISLIRNMFHDDAQRTFAIGAYTTCFSLGTMIGPLAGGVLLAHFHWGAVFLMSIPVMGILLITGPLFLPEYKNGKTEKFDLFSAFLMTAATLSTIFGIKRLAENGPILISSIAIILGLALGYLFIRRQNEHADPLIDLDLFRVPAFNAALIALLLALFCCAGMLLFTAQYLQLIRGMAPLTAGLWTIPSAMGSTITCLLAPKLLRWMRRPTAMILGLAMVAAGMFALALMQGSNGLALLIAGTTIVSGGCGLIVTMGIDTVIAAAPQERAGEAAGISETSTGFGSALGIAIMGSIGTIIYRSHIPVSVLDQLSPVQSAAARGTLGGALDIAKQLRAATGATQLVSPSALLSEALSERLSNAAHTAFAQSFRFTVFSVALLMTLMTCILGRILNKTKIT